MTVGAPITMGAPQPVRSPIRAAGKPLIRTVLLPGGTMGERWVRPGGRRHRARMHADAHHHGGRTADEHVRYARWCEHTAVSRGVAHPRGHRHLVSFCFVPDAAS